MNKVNLTWRGPFGWLPGEKTTIFDSNYAESSGIYVWAVPLKNQRLIYYVGQTRVGFANRQFDHWTEYMRGAYTINDSDALSKGERRQVYKGYVYKKPKWKLAQPFFYSFSELSNNVIEMLRVMEIWVAEVKPDSRLQRRIESSIVEFLYNAKSPAAEFQEPGMRTAPRRSEEEIINVKSEPPDLFMGLPDEFEA